MPRTNGLRKVGAAWKDWDYRASRKPALVIPTPEEAAQRRIEEDERIARFLAEQNNTTGIARVVNREARVAVEGNTDLNHDNVEGGGMSLTPPPPTWTPASLDFERVATCSHLMIEVARHLGFTRETYVAAVAQMAEAAVGHDPQGDIDGEVLRFVGERFRAVADAIERSAS